MRKVILLLLAAGVATAFAATYEYKGARYVRIGNVVYDVGRLIEWKQIEMNEDPYRTKLKRFESFYGCYQDYFIAGTVLQVLDNALLVKSFPHDNTLMVLHHPEEKNLVDGNSFNWIIAVKMGRTNYVTVAGSKATVELWDCGVPVKLDYNKAPRTLPPLRKSSFSN